MKYERPLCVHVWIDRDDPLRAPVAPIIGTQPEMMLRGHTYKCRECGVTFVVPPR